MQTKSDNRARLDFEGAVIPIFLLFLIHICEFISANTSERLRPNPLKYRQIVLISRA